MLRSHQVPIRLSDSDVESDSRSLDFAPSGHSARDDTSFAARPEGDLRESQGRFARTAWDGAEAHLPQYLYDHTTPRLLATKKASAYIKIAEGCDHPCSFCVIPNLRGKFRSRRFESVIAEAEAWWRRACARSR